VAPHRTGEIGRFGEALARQILVQRGYHKVIAIQNPSGHGIDLVGVKTGRGGGAGLVAYFEIKTTTTQRSGGLSAAQQNVEDFVVTRLTRAAADTRLNSTTRRDTRYLLAEIQKERRPIGGAIIDVTGVGNVRTLKISVRRWHRATPRRSPRGRSPRGRQRL
jgi:hypothetical protein